jgi:hypothetical protein
MKWQEFCLPIVFRVLFAAGLVATLSDSTLSNARGAWLAQAMR